MFFDALDRSGGHVFTCLLLILIGGAFYHFGFTAEGHDLILFATGVLARSMMGNTKTTDETTLALERMPQPALTTQPASEATRTVTPLRSQQ